MSKAIVCSISSVVSRICDVGGWLDTWFAKYGEVLNLGVYSAYFGSEAPFRGIEVLVNEKKLSGSEKMIRIYAADPSYDIELKISDLVKGRFDQKNLLLATLYLLRNRLEVGESDLDIRICSPIPPGASMGTSASISVALTKAICGRSINNDTAAQMAWRAETEIMGGQSGTQDQYAAAYSRGAHFLTVDYPQTRVEVVNIPVNVKKSLESGLITVFYGQHSSFSSHRRVIKELENEGPQSPRLENLRGLARKARECILSSDLEGFGTIMSQNTEAQGKLYHGIISNSAQSIIKLAGEYCALGYKINGAGGSGGSVTILFGSDLNARNFYVACQEKYSPRLGFKYFKHKFPV